MMPAGLAADLWPLYRRAGLLSKEKLLLMGGEGPQPSTWVPQRRASALIDAMRRRLDIPGSFSFSVLFTVTGQKPGKD